MSAFIVEDRSINRIVDFCYALAFENEWPLALLKPPRPLNGPEDLEAFGRELFAMNVAAVTARYGSADDMLGDQPYEYRPDPTPVHEWDLYQVAKSLDCYLYQCSEGYVPKRALFKQVSGLRDSVVRVLVSSDPRYEAAAWE